MHGSGLKTDRSLPPDMLPGESFPRRLITAGFLCHRRLWIFCIAVTGDLSSPSFFPPPEYDHGCGVLPLRNV